MTAHAGIVRNEQLLTEGLAKLEREKKNFVKSGNELFELMGENLIIVAELIIKSTLERKESRGGHFREDFPAESETFIHHIVQQREREISSLPVNKTI